jgi:hypothetical protein
MIASTTLDYSFTCPATEALEHALHTFPSREYITSNEFMSTIRCQKRRKPSADFDLSDLLSAAQPVEDSISFPIIAWDRDGSDTDEGESCDYAPNSDYDHDDDEDTQPSRKGSMSSLGKRNRPDQTEMVRSQSYKTSLSSLGSSSTSQALRKTGSCFEFSSSKDSFQVDSLGQSKRPARSPFHLTPLAA